MTTLLLLCSEGLQLGDNSKNNASHVWSTLFSIFIQFCKLIVLIMALGSEGP